MSLNCIMYTLLVSNIKTMWILLFITETQFHTHTDGLEQERCNSIANALELRLSCTNPLIFDLVYIPQALMFPVPMWGPKLKRYCPSRFIVSDNGLLPRQRQAIIWTNADVLALLNARSAVDLVPTTRCHKKDIPLHLPCFTTKRCQI